MGSGDPDPFAHLKNLDNATVLVQTLCSRQPPLEAHNISDNVRQSDFLSLEEKFLPVCAGLAHCKDFGVETGFYMFLFFLSGTC